MFDNWRHRLAVAILPGSVRKDASSPFRVIATQTAGLPVYSEMSVRKATREGYKMSVSVYRAIRVIVQAASAIPWIVQDSKGEPIEGHEFAKVWAKPNREFSGQDNMEFIIAHQLLVGNSLIQPIIVGGKPKEFWMVMPDLVQPIPSEVPGEWLRGWRVTPANGRQYDAPPEQFIHFMQVDPGNPYWGIGPLMAAARTIDTDNEAQDTQKISMQNRGTPDGVFEAESMSSEQYEEAQKAIQERYLSKEKRRLPWVVAGAKWHQMSLTPVEMDYIASRLQNKRDIAGAFGISPIFLGDLSQTTYSNMMEARKALYEDVVIPLLDDIKATLNLKIAPLYGDIVIAYDVTGIPALRADYGKKVDQAKTLWAMGIPFDQINERLEMGFEQFPGWDRGYLPLTLLPTGASPATPEEEVEKALKSLEKLMPTTLDEAIPWLEEMRGRVSDKWINDALKSLELSTEEAKVAHWKRIDRRRVGWWGVVSKKVLPLYEAEAKAIEKAIKGKKPEKLLAAASSAIDAGSPEWEKVLTAVSAALIEDFGNEIAEDLGAEKSDKPAKAKWAFDPMSSAARAWIVKHGAQSIKTILATNLGDVKRVILAGMDEKLTTTQIARNLRTFYSDHSPFKAMRIARTETSHAAGFGQREAAKQSGVVKKKTWLTSRDDRVRDSHAAMEGETVDLDKRYSDGSMYPGEQDIMCRCVESYGTR